MNKIKTPQHNSKLSSTNIVYSSKKRILLVDDEPDITLTYKIALESSGLFEVYIFNEPLNALANFKAHFYDLVLSDVNMLNMNGYQLCLKIKETDNNIKICLLSASEVDHQHSEERELACCFIKKPIAISELIKQINSILK
jgi:DNA-binding NtrC family response regulator